MPLTKQQITTLFDKCHQYTVMTNYIKRLMKKLNFKNKQMSCSLQMMTCHVILTFCQVFLPLFDMNVVICQINALKSFFRHYATEGLNAVDDNVSQKCKRCASLRMNQKISISIKFNENPTKGKTI